LSNLFLLLEMEDYFFNPNTRRPDLMRIPYAQVMLVKNGTAAPGSGNRFRHYAIFAFCGRDVRLPCL